MFYSHVNYSVTKIERDNSRRPVWFYSHVNYSVTKIWLCLSRSVNGFTVT